jgi:hypothetical protein
VAPARLRARACGRADGRQLGGGRMEGRECSRSLAPFAGCGTWRTAAGTDACTSGSCATCRAPTPAEASSAAVCEGCVPHAVHVCRTVLRCCVLSLMAPEHLFARHSLRWLTHSCLDPTPTNGACSTIAGPSVAGRGEARRGEARRGEARRGDSGAKSRHGMRLS